MASYKYFKEEIVRKLAYNYYKEEITTTQLMKALEAEIQKRLDEDYIAIWPQEELKQLPEGTKGTIAKAINGIDMHIKAEIKSNSNKANDNSKANKKESK